MTIRKTMGPPETAANDHIYQRLRLNCKECECCGKRWHYLGRKDKGLCIQVRVGGRLMAVRRAAYMAAFPDKPILQGRRITSKCKNEYCINPELLIQATAGGVLKSQYEKGVRSRQKTAATLASYRPMKMTAELALKVLHDERPANKVADELGFSAGYIRSIRRGEFHRAFTPFAGLGAR